MAEDSKYSSTYNRRTACYPTPRNKSLLDGYSGMTGQPKNSVINEALDNYWKSKGPDVINQIRKMSKNSY